MIRKYSMIITSILLAALVTSCDQMTKQDAGALSGGLIGGLVGSQFGRGGGQILAIGIGTVAGAMLGSSIGKSMDDTDRLKMMQTLERNPIGEPAYWHNHQTGTEYVVVPTRNVNIRGNRYCREYRTTAEIAGKKQQIYGTACRQPDGSWKVVK